MNLPIGMAVVVGVLLAVWVKVAAVLGMPWFVGLIGWACYVAAGRKMKGLVQVIAAGVAGMAWVAVLDMGALVSGHEELELVAVGVAAIAVLLESRVSLLSYIPAGLCGIAVMGAGGPMGLMDLPGNTKLGLSFVIGAVLGFVAEWVGDKVSKRPARA
jgi:hypothetical protein